MKRMFVGAVVVILASSVSATLLTSDDFSYTGALTANGWSAYSGADASITSDGSVASVGSGGEDIRLVFSEQLASPVYARFTLNISSLPSSGSEYSWGFADGSQMYSRWGIVVEDSGNAFGIGAWGTGSTLGPTYSSLSLNTDYTIAFYFDGTDDHRLWINPLASDFNSPNVQTTVVPTTVGFDGFFIRQAGALDQGASSWTVDDVLAATTFGEVAIPEPTTVALFAIAATGLLVLRKRH